jgi:hypothetical protein
MGGIPERLIDVALNVRVKGDHLADGHGVLLHETKPVDSTLVPLEHQRRTP